MELVRDDFILSIDILKLDAINLKVEIPRKTCKLKHFVYDFALDLKSLQRSISPSWGKDVPKPID